MPSCALMQFCLLGCIASGSRLSFAICAQSASVLKLYCKQPVCERLRKALSSVAFLFLNTLAAMPPKVPGRESVTVSRLSELIDLAAALQKRVALLQAASCRLLLLFPGPPPTPNWFLQQALYIYSLVTLCRSCAVPQAEVTELRATRDRLANALRKQQAMRHALLAQISDNACEVRGHHYSFRCKFISCSSFRWNGSNYCL